MKRTLALAALLAAASLGHAAEGVIEINHAKVMAGGGYPYVITQSGSYRLTSNLAQPDANTHAIQIQASDVTLDLNGFAITGANECTYSPGPPPTLSCSGAGAGMGVVASELNVTVRNGSVTGMGNSCVLLGRRGQLHDLSVSHCGSHGIFLQSGTISRAHASYSQWAGIVTQGATISDSMATNNGTVGILAPLGGSVVRHSLASNNVQAGIQFSSGIGTVTGNTIESNGGTGLNVFGAVTYSGNAIAGNSGGATFGNLLNGGGNICDGAACP